MAKLTDVYRAEDVVSIGHRQIPVVAGAGDDSSLMMLMDLNSKGLCIDSPLIRGRELEEFTRKFNLLTAEEMRQSLEIDSSTLVALLNQCVPCVGCRRRVERLFYQLTLSGHPTLDPLVLKSTCVLTVRDERMATPQALGTLLYRHHEVLNNLLESKLRNKTRCVLHSLDAFRSRPFSETWREVWFSMKHNCRDELAIIETKELHEVLENYLKKHKFCQGCRTKIEKAYQILVNETTSKEGFVAALYANIRKSHSDNHIQIITKKVDFLDALIRRAEPEVNGSYSKQRERHAKTLEIAQEEVLTCVGMIMYERLRRIYVSLREEERACQVLAAVSVHALCSSFDMAVEKKQGISNLELLYQEISRAEKAKEYRREQKKLKKKLKKIEKKNSHRKSEKTENDGDSDTAEAHEEEEEEELDEAVYLGDDSDEADGLLEPNLLSQETVVVASEGREGCLKADGKLEPTQSQKKRKQKQKQKHKQPQKKSSKKRTHEQPLKLQQRVEQERERVPAQSAQGSVYSCDTDKCGVCLAPPHECPCENDVKDSGYGSESNSPENSRTSSAASSPEGSEVSCSDGFCNHDHGGSGAGDGHDLVEDEQLSQHELWAEAGLCRGYGNNWSSLQQMLDNLDDNDEDDVYIPQEVVLEYQCQREWVQQQRQQLRQTLRQNFDRLCMQKGQLFTANCK